MRLPELGLRHAARDDRGGRGNGCGKKERAMERLDDHVGVDRALQNGAAIGAGDERKHHGAEKRSACRAAGRARKPVQRGDHAEALAAALMPITGIQRGRPVRRSVFAEIIAAVTMPPVTGKSRTPAYCALTW